MVGQRMVGANRGEGSKKKEKTPKYGINLRQWSIVQLKHDLWDMLPKTNFTSKWKKINDTKLAPYNMNLIRDRTFQHNPSPWENKILKSGIVHVAAFPPAKQWPKIMAEFDGRYDIETSTYP